MDSNEVVELFSEIVPQNMPLILRRKCTLSQTWKKKLPHYYINVLDPCGGMLQEN